MMQRLWGRKGEEIGSVCVCVCVCRRVMPCVCRIETGGRDGVGPLDKKTRGKFSSRARDYHITRKTKKKRKEKEKEEGKRQQEQRRKPAQHRVASFALSVGV